MTEVLTLVQLNSIAAVTAVLPVPRAPQRWYQYCDEYLHMSQSSQVSKDSSNSLSIVQFQV